MVHNNITINEQYLVVFVKKNYTLNIRFSAKTDDNDNKKTTRKKSS